MTDIRVDLDLSDGRQITIYVPQDDADRIMKMVGDGYGSVEFETEDCKRHVLTATGVSHAQTAAASAPWELNIGLVDDSRLYELGLMDGDEAPHAQAHPTSDPEISGEFGVTIYSHGLASRPPAGLRAKLTGLHAQGIHARIRQTPLST
jgi:hypothetical protein